LLPPPVSLEAGGVDGADESAGGVAGANAPESLGAGAGAGIGDELAGAAGALAGGIDASGAAGASSRLLQPARTAVNTAAARRVWRIIIFCLQGLWIMDLPEFDDVQEQLFRFRANLPVRKPPILMSVIRRKICLPSTNRSPRAKRHSVAL